MPKIKNNTCHPNSRRAQKLSKTVTRLKKLERSKQAKQSRVSTKVSKFMWFKEMIDPTKTVYEACDVEEMIERYLCRFDDELFTIVDLHASKGALSSHYRSQHASKEDEIRNTIERERELFNSTGIELPDITTTKGLKAFMDWQGQREFLTSLKMKRYRNMKNKSLSEV